MADRSMISARFGVEGDADVERALRNVERAGQDLAAALKKAGEQGTIDLGKVERALQGVEQQAGRTAARGRDVGDALSEGARRAETGIGGLNSRTLVLGTTIGNVLGQGITFAVDQLGRMAAEVWNTYEAMKDLGEQTGLTIAQIQALRQVVRGEGGDVEQLNRALVTYSRTLGQAGEGNARANAAFDRLGINIRNVDGTLRNANVVLLETLHALARTEDAATRNALGIPVLGQAWIKVADAFKNGERDIDAATEALRRNGALIDEEAQKKIEALTKAVASGSEAWKGLALNLLADVSPALVRVAQDAERASKSFGGLLEFIAKYSALGLLTIGPRTAIGNIFPDTVGPPVPSGSSRPLRMQEADLERELANSLRAHRGETVDSARIRQELARVRDAILLRAAAEAREKMIREAGDPADYPLGPPPGWRAPGPDIKEPRGGGRTGDAEQKAWERAQKALDDYLESLAREADLADEDARSRAGHTAQLKAEALARAEILKLSEEQVQAIGQEARARAEAAYDAKKAQEDEKKARQDAEREMQRLADQEARLLRQPLERAIQETYGLVTDLFEQALSGNLESWGKFWNQAKQIARRYLAEMATLLVIRPIVQPLISAAGLGGLLPGAGLGSGAGSVSIGGVPYIPAGGGSSGGGGILSLLSGGGVGGGGGDFLGLGSFFGQTLYGGAELYGPALPGQVMGSIGGVTVGNALSGILGIGTGILSLSQGNWLGGATGILGGALSFVPGLGPVGAAIGLLGGLLGGFMKKKPKTPQEVSNIFFGPDGITNAIGYSRGKSLGSTGPAAGAFADAFGDLLDAYGLSTTSGFGGGWILNSIGKNTGNQWIVGTGAYNPGDASRTLAAGLTSPEQAIDILAAALFKQGAATGTLQGLTVTQQRAINSTDLKSIEEIKKALDFSALYDEVVRGKDNVTAAEQAVKALNDQFKALTRQAADYGLDVGVLDTRRIEAINKLATDTNEDYRRRLLSLTPEGALQVALEDLDKARDQALKEAAYLNSVVTEALVDINQIEEFYAKARVQIVEQANQQATAALQDIWKRLSYGDLSGAPPLAALTGAQASADALYAQAQAGSLTAMANLPQAVSELFTAQLAFSGNDPRYEALRQTWLERLAPYVAGNSNATGAANGNAVDGGLLAQSQQQIDQLTQQVQTLVATVQDQSREISRLLARL